MVMSWKGAFLRNGLIVTPKKGGIFHQDIPEVGEIFYSSWPKELDNDCQYPLSSLVDKKWRLFCSYYCSNKNGDPELSELPALGFLCPNNK